MPVTRMTAMSVAPSVPRTLPLAFVPSANVTVMVLAPSTTCALVTMSPFVSTTKPLPSALVLTTRSTTPGDAFL
jgi:hypothetical protein